MTAEYDTVQRFGESVLQHGRISNRVYIMKADPAGLADLLQHVDDLVRKHGYTKVFAKASATAAPLFEQHGYTCEAEIPGFYGSGEACRFMSLFVVPERAVDDASTREVLAACERVTPTPAAPSLPPGAQIRAASPPDADAMARIYAATFETYPFPVDNPDYIQQTMASHVAYFLVTRANRMIALASAEGDPAAPAVEMTDFAVLPEFRGNALGNALLARMEAHVRRRGIRTAYTIARARSYGMNITFARADYRFAGTLVNNTGICGTIESMNVWFKPLSVPAS